MTLLQANIHSFIESDDRVNIVLKYLDDALKELDSLDSVIASYKIHLNVRGSLRCTLLASDDLATTRLSTKILHLSSHKTVVSKSRRRTREPCSMNSKTCLCVVHRLPLWTNVDGIPANS